MFPFKYKGITHNKCTKVDSTTPWCANKVNERTGDAVNGQWADCEPGCETGSLTQGEALGNLLGILGQGLGDALSQQG